MSIIDSRYEKAKSIQHGFMGGLASWMTEDITGGGSLTTEATNGGRAVASTGTTAEGDGSGIDLDPITPDTGQFDAVGLNVTFNLNSAATTEGDAVVLIGFFESSNIHRVFHQVNHPWNPHAFRVSVSDSDTYHDTRVNLPTDVVESELVWDVSNDELIHRYQDTFAARVSGGLPDPTLDYEPTIGIDTKNTSSDMVMNIYDVELSYYNRTNR